MSEVLLIERNFLGRICFNFFLFEVKLEIWCEAAASTHISHKIYFKIKYLNSDERALCQSRVALIRERDCEIWRRERLVAPPTLYFCNLRVVSEVLRVIDKAAAHFSQHFMPGMISPIRLNGASVSRKTQNSKLKNLSN